MPGIYGSKQTEEGGMGLEGVTLVSEVGVVRVGGMDEISPLVSEVGAVRVEGMVEILPLVEEVSMGVLVGRVAGASGRSHVGSISPGKVCI